MSISEEKAQRLLAFIRTKLGLAFTTDKIAEVERAVLNTARELRVLPPESFVDSLLSGKPDHTALNTLAYNLTINETYFFREPLVLESFAKRARSLIHERRQGEKSLRIWSAGCSSGEEVYTIAILLHEMLPDIKDWAISLLGTDISGPALEKAQGGVYGAWSFRGVDDRYLQKYFTPLPDGFYSVAEHIKSFPHFARLNLFEDNYPSPITRTNFLDFIFCRNVLMYFDNDGREYVLKRFYDALKMNGALFLSLTELAQQSHSRFSRQRDGDAFYFVKDPYAGKKTTGEAGMPVQGIEPKHTAAPQRQMNGLPPVLPKQEKHASFFLNDIRLSFLESRFQDIYDAFLALTKAEAGDFFDAASETEWSLIIRSAANLGKRSAAVELCEQALSRHKTSPYLFLLLAGICLEEERYPEAIAALKKCLYLDNSFLAAYYLLFSIYRRTGNAAEAQRNADIFMKLAATVHPGTPLEGMDDVRVGDILYMIGTSGR